MKILFEYELLKKIVGLAIFGIIYLIIWIKLK